MELELPMSVEAIESPRLKWIKKHQINTMLDKHHDKDCEYEPWAAWSADLSEALNEDNLGLGKTEHDAIADWAVKNGVRLWNEEGL